MVFSMPYTYHNTDRGRHGKIGPSRAGKRTDDMHHNTHHGIVENGKTHLRDLSLADLGEFVARYGEPAYRYRQIASWLYGKMADDFSEMTDLPLRLREMLAENARVRSLNPVSVEESAVDGTRKYLLELYDGKRIETVIMSHGKRVTLCESTQVGCPMDCVF